MKTLLAFAVLFFWGTLSAAEAQQRGWNGTMPGIQQLVIEHGDELNLTDEQKTALVEKSIERRSEMRTQRTRGIRQRNNIRGERRGESSRWQQQSPESRDQERPYLSRDNSELLREILTEDQLATLQNIRIERAEKQHEFRTLRHQSLVESAGLESGKAEEVIRMLNSISEHQKMRQITYIENPDEWNRPAARESAQQLRDMHDEIKHLLTAAEYEKLQRTMRPGGAFQQNRLSSRPMMRSR
jgi:hypothetical protein